MSEEQDDSSKTEDPSGRKLEKAHEEGQFAISREINHLTTMIGILVIVVWLAPPLAAGLSSRLKHFIADAAVIPTDAESVRLIISESFLDVVVYAGAPLGLLMALGIMATVLQIGFHITWGQMKIDFNKLNPIAGFQRMMKLDRQALEMGKNLAKLGVVGLVAFYMLKPVVLSFERYIDMDMRSLLSSLHRSAFRLLFAILLVVAAISIGDLLYQRWTFFNKMKMSKQEVKDEYKQTEGDPLVKGKLRGMRMQKARQRMMAAVPQADVVVTNPTHFAVAMKYDPTGGKAPVVVAKGADHIAANIRKIAEANDVPIVQNPPLARALYDTVEIDQEIPAEHYRAVAEVITFVFKLKGKSLRG